MKLFILALCGLLLLPGCKGFLEVPDYKHQPDRVVSHSPDGKVTLYCHKCDSGFPVYYSASGTSHVELRGKTYTNIQVPNAEKGGDHDR